MVENEVMILLLNAIILHCQLKIQQERTINSIYHLLTGKQSIQTIQDAHLFQLEKYYALYKSLDKKVFANKINELLELKYINKRDEHTFEITDMGKQFLAQQQLNEYYWDGLKFREIDDLFYQRLLLFIQVWTNARRNNYRYIPIVDHPETLHWIKRFYLNDRKSRLIRLKQLYNELVELFSQISPIYPEMFIKQITTNKAIGLTYEQLAKYYDKSVTDIYLLHMNYVHFILENVFSHYEKYPLLFHFVTDLIESEQKTVTNSAKITLKLIEQGLTLEEIAKKRNLKINTINDHIVEIALQDEHFPIDQFVSQKKQQEIYHAVKQLKSLKLKDIKSAVSNEINYFEIRLALIKFNRLYGE